jgi:hypothetical protein
MVSFSVRSAQSAVRNGGGNPVLALLDRGIRQSDDRDFIGVPPTGVDLDLHFKRFDTDDRRRITPKLRRYPACLTAISSSDDSADQGPAHSNSESSKRSK